MAYWLFKSELNTWSWSDQIAVGSKGTEWDGVRNYQARNNMDKMKINDLGFFYHSVKERISWILLGLLLKPTTIQQPMIVLGDV